MSQIIKYFRHITFLLLLFAVAACSTLRDQKRAGITNTEPTVVLETYYEGRGIDMTVSLRAGKSFNHPLMAIWIEDTLGQYIQTLYVAQSIAQGIFRHGDPSSGRWEPGVRRRPAALPYWGHKRGIQASDGLYIPEVSHPMPDALTGATPKGNFLLKSHSPANAPSVVRVYFEINQSWDWNRFWTNNKFPGDADYMTSSQPAVVYMAEVDLKQAGREYIMKAVGHSHWSGQTGEMFTDLSTLTTALEIADRITVVVGR